MKSMTTTMMKKIFPTYWDEFQKSTEEIHWRMLPRKDHCDNHLNLLFEEIFDEYLSEEVYHSNASLLMDVILA